MIAMTELILQIAHRYATIQTPDGKAVPIEIDSQISGRKISMEIVD